MFRERFPSFPSSAANGAALSARTHTAEANTAHDVDTQGIVERVNAYGFHTDVVTSNGTWWMPFLHPHTVTPLSTGVTISWPL